MAIETFTEFIGKLPAYKEGDLASYSEYTQILREKELAYMGLHPAPIRPYLKTKFEERELGKRFELSVSEWMDLTVTQKRRHADIKGTLVFLLMERYLTMEDFHEDILVFGVGSDTSPIMLSRYANSVTALEKDPRYKYDLAKLAGFDGIEAYNKDGIEFMADKPEASYGLICAFGFGDWNTDIGLVERFASESKRVLIQQKR
jgi:hypothetical protein